MNRFDSFVKRLISDYGFLKVFLFSFFSIGILSLSLSFFALSLGRPYMGVILALESQGWTVQSLDGSGQASLDGITPGDRPVEINGQPAMQFLDEYQEAGVFLGRSINNLTVMNKDGNLVSANLAGSSLSYQSFIPQVMWLIVTLLFWITGFYVFFRSSKHLAALLLCLCSLNFGLVLSSNMAAGIGISTAAYFEVTASAIGPWLLFHFFLILPEERAWLRGSLKLYIIYLPAVLTVVLFPIIGYINDQPVQWFRSFRLFEYGAGFLAAVGAVIFNYLQAKLPRTRQQMKIVMVSCLGAIVPVLFLSVLPQMVWRQPAISPGYTILFIGFIPLGMGYAVVTQKLMDIDVIIRRSIIYGLISLVMAIILSMAIFISLSFQGSIGPPQQISIALILGGIAVGLFGPVKNGIEAIVDRLFYKDRYDYRKIIHSLNVSLNTLKDVVEISRVVVGTTVNTLNLYGGIIFIKSTGNNYTVCAAQGIFDNSGKQNQLLALISQPDKTTEFPNPASGVDLAYLIPLKAGEKEVGMLCLSHKASRQDFSSDDMFLLQGIASVAASALHSATLVRDVSLRDTFISVASHELRTPLTSIVGYADLLLRRDPDSTTRKRWTQNILENGERVSHMVDDLLNVSRIQSGKVIAKLEDTNISDVVAETVSLIKESSDNHEFIINLESRLPGAYVDRDKFSQVIGNLLSNAVKYSPKGGHIAISAHYNPEMHRVVLSVSDEGMGIDDADKALLFTTFHRIQRPETQGIRGSGLGLYIVKEWTEAMGGEVWFESELNRGSTFFVAVPTKNSNATQK